MRGGSSISLTGHSKTNAKWTRPAPSGTLADRGGGEAVEAAGRQADLTADRFPRGVVIDGTRWRHVESRRPKDE